MALTLASLASLSAAETCNLVSWRGKTNVNGAPGSLEKDSGGSNTWNAGAMSTQSLSASPQPQSLTFMCKVGGSVAAGLTNQESGLSYEDIQFAVSCQADGKLSVFESGKYVGAFGDWATTDVYKVQVTGSTVQYLKNVEVCYSSATPATFPLHVDVSMIGEGTKLSDVAMCVPSPCVSSAATWAEEVGVAGSPGELIATTIAGSPGAVSSQAIAFSTLPQSVSFQCSDGGYIKAGLGNDKLLGNDFGNDIEFAIYCRNYASGLEVYESGASQGNFGTWTADDVMKVQVTGDTVQYLKNGDVFYTSATAPTFPLRVDASLSGGASFPNPKVSAVTICSVPTCSSSAATWADATNVAAASGSLQKNAGGQGWNAGAISNQELTSSTTTQSVSFKCATGAGMMIGELASARTDSHYCASMI